MKTHAYSQEIGVAKWISFEPVKMRSHMIWIISGISVAVMIIIFITGIAVYSSSERKYAGLATDIWQNWK